jgi:hypothetical protein
VPECRTEACRTRAVRPQKGTWNGSRATTGGVQQALQGPARLGTHGQRTMITTRPAGGHCWVVQACISAGGTSRASILAVEVIHRMLLGSQGPWAGTKPSSLVRVDRPLACPSMDCGRAGWAGGARGKAEKKNQMKKQYKYTSAGSTLVQ